MVVPEISAFDPSRLGFGSPTVENFGDNCELVVACRVQLFDGDVVALHKDVTDGSCLW